MPKSVRCVCGESVSCDDDASPSAACPGCGRALSPDHVSRARIPDADFVDPTPAAAESVAAAPPLWLRMLLDPRTIHRLLFVGGGISVLGLVAWLASLGVFDDPRVLAVALGVGTASVMVAGWAVALRTRYRVAGHALTFLACVVAPLNLWFCDAQGLVTVEGHLWVGGLICSLAYLATVMVLRQPVFLYAFEAGITLTVFLLLGGLQHETESIWIVTALLSLGALSIHAERVFSPEHEVFSRRRFGQPLFVSGQVQVAAAMLSLLTLQVLDWLWMPLGPQHWAYSQLAGTPWLAGCLWLAAGALCFYSDLVVRRTGISSYIGTVALVFAEITFLQDVLTIDSLIAVLAATALAVRLATRCLMSAEALDNRVSDGIGLGVALVPVLMGLVRHLTWPFANVGPLEPFWFAGAMGVVTVATIASALVDGRRPSRFRVVYWSTGAVSAWIAGLHVLQGLGWTGAECQLPLLLTGPLVLAATCALRSTAEWLRDLLAATHALIVAGVMLLLARFDGSVAAFLSSRAGDLSTLLAAATFAELAAIYWLSSVAAPRKTVFRVTGGLWAVVAAWKLVVYFNLPEAYYAPLLALVGVVCGAMHRLTLASPKAAETKMAAATGWSAASDLLLVVAELSAFWRGTARLLLSQGAVESWQIAAVGATAVLAFVGALLAASTAGRRWHTAGALVVGLVALVATLRLLQLADYQKVEVGMMVVGCLLLISGYAGRLRESSGRREADVSIALWVGAALAALPVLGWTMSHRWFGPSISLFDELALVTVTLLMVATGCIFQVRSATTIGSGALAVYLATLFAHLAYRPQVAVAVYLAIGGAAIFLVGVLLSVYRDRLLALPSKIAQREGIFCVMDWR